jgi:ubiquitin-protein ligase
MAGLKSEDMASLSHLTGRELPRCARRIVRELQNSLASNIPYISLSCLDECPPEDLLGIIQGPPNSPYEEGIFFVRIRAPLTTSSDEPRRGWGYPLAPPTIRFVTPIYHPNVSEDGWICLEPQWSPCWTLELVLLMILGLLDHPDAEDPMEVEIASQYVHQQEDFDQIARAFTRENATGDRPSLESLKKMGRWWRDAEPHARGSYRRDTEAREQADEELEKGLVIRTL